MKTALQQLYEEVDSLSIREVFVHLIANRNMYYELEKQQIIDAYWGGLNGCINDYSETKTVGGELIGIKIGKGAEHYYDRTFNPNSFEKTEERGQKIK